MSALPELYDSEAEPEVKTADGRVICCDTLLVRQPSQHARPGSPRRYAGWDEAQHPRGQPENAGEFGPGGYGGHGAGGGGVATKPPPVVNPPEEDTSLLPESDFSDEPGSSPDNPSSTGSGLPGEMTDDEWADSITQTFKPIDTAAERRRREQIDSGLRDRSGRWKAGGAHASILAHLGAKPQTLKQLAASTGLSGDNLFNAMQHLVQEGHVGHKMKRGDVTHHPQGEGETYKSSPVSDDSLLHNLSSGPKTQKQLEGSFGSDSGTKGDVADTLRDLMGSGHVGYTVKNGNISYHPTGKAYTTSDRLLKRTSPDKIVGAPQGATVDHEEFHSRGDDDIPDEKAITIEVDHPHLRSCSRTLGVDRDGKKFIRNDILKVKDTAPRGFGSSIFKSQVQEARKAGYSYIKTHAAGEYGSSMNGYYTWPSLGYDQSLTSMEGNSSTGDRTVKKARKVFPEAKSVLDIMSTPEVHLSEPEAQEVRDKCAAVDQKLGRPVRDRSTITGKDWWMAHGSDMYDAVFDLTPGSRSMQVFEAHGEKK